MKNGVCGGSAETIQAAPTQVPVPISATRSRPREAARTWSRRPTSGRHERSKPRRSVSASAFSTSGGTTFLDYWRAPDSLRTGTPTASARSGASTTRRDSRTPSAGAPSSRSSPRPTTASGSRSSSSTCRTRSARRASSSSSPGARGRGRSTTRAGVCEFVYRNLGSLTQIVPTLDTHQALQIFHRALLIDGEGRHPEPFTLVTAEDVEAGRWRINPLAAAGLGLDPDYAEEHLRYYTRTLEQGGKYNLTIWPFHAMLGGIGHALVSALEEALFFHSVVRNAPLDFQPKGDNAADRALLDARPRGGGRPRGRAARPAQPAADRAAAPVRRGRDRRRGQEPLRRLDDRGPALRPERAGARARGEGLPARGLHLVRRRPRLGRLHRRGRRPLRPLRRVRRARRPLRSAADRVARRRRRVVRRRSR